MQRIYLRRKASFLVGAALLVLVGTGIAVGMASEAASGAAVPGPPPATIGVRLDRPVPGALGSAEFMDQRGNPVTLRDFSGRAVFLVPFLTSCQEECPITTGGLEEIQRALVADHLAREVSIVEVTVDPARDTPERLAAYAKLVGTSWPLLTASPATIAALWHFFGIYYQEVPEASPPGIDWQSRRPYTYDVDHSNGFILLDAHLRERFVAAGMVRGAHLRPALRHLLDAQGRRNLAHPGGGSWTIAQARNAIAWVLGRAVP